MRISVPLLLLCLALPSGCLPTDAGRSQPSRQEAAAATAAISAGQPAVSLGRDWPWNACGPEEGPDENPGARGLDAPSAESLNRAACLAASLSREADGGEGEEWARQGLDLALQVLKGDPEECRAQYLAAWFLYRLAEGAEWSDQAMVRDLEDHALAAARGCPALDGGGPLRLLGRVDLDSPQKPAGLGDVAQAEEHYRAALTLAPGRLENRLGLAEALLAKGDTPLACLEIQELVAAMPPREDLIPAWRRTLELLRGLCFLHSR